MGITHPVDLGPAPAPANSTPPCLNSTPAFWARASTTSIWISLTGPLRQAVCLDKPVTEFAFEVTNSDLTMPEWAAGWGRIHFPPVKLLEAQA